MDITELLAFSVKNNASDLHLSAGLQPMIRVDGELQHIKAPPMEHEMVPVSYTHLTLPTIYSV